MPSCHLFVVSQGCLFWPQLSWRHTTQESFLLLLPPSACCSTHRSGLPAPRANPLSTSVKEKPSSCQAALPAAEQSTLLPTAKSTLSTLPTCPGSQSWCALDEIKGMWFMPPEKPGLFPLSPSKLENINNYKHFKALSVLPPNKLCSLSLLIRVSSLPG